MKAKCLALLSVSLLFLGGCASMQLGGDPYKEYNSDTGQWQDVVPAVSFSSQPKQKRIELKPSRDSLPEAKE
jgi:hypothetical protein